MQINVTKGVSKLKLAKRERDLLIGARNLCAELGRFGIGEMSEHAEAAHDGLVELIHAIAVHEYPAADEAAEPAAKGESETTTKITDPKAIKAAIDSLVKQESGEPAAKGESNAK